MMEDVNEKFDFLSRVQKAQALGYFNARFEEVCEYDACMAACALDPEYCSDPVIKRGEVTDALNRVARRLLGDDDFGAFINQLGRYNKRETGLSWDNYHG